MLAIILRPILVLFAVSLFQTPSGQNTEQDKIILVDVEVSNPNDAKKAYTPTFDKNRVELEVDFDDPIYSLSDYILEEDRLEGPDCFYPEMKIIFREYTYVVSLYCTSVVKYQNSKPYTTSNRRANNDLIFTESVFDILMDARKKYFGKSMDVKTGEKFLHNKPLADENVDDEFLYHDEDEQADEDLENEAIDEEGIFDETEDPDLELEQVDESDG